MRKIKAEELCQIQGLSNSDIEEIMTIMEDNTMYIQISNAITEESCTNLIAKVLSENDLGSILQNAKVVFVKVIGCTDFEMVADAASCIQEALKEDVDVVFSMAPNEMNPEELKIYIIMAEKIKI